MRRTRGARLRGVRWAHEGSFRRRALLGVLGLWALVSAARLTRLVEPPEPPPGQDLVAPQNPDASARSSARSSPQPGTLLDFFRSHIPRDAGYLFVLPGEFGTPDSGDGPRLRYELYPRIYDDVRASVDESNIRQLMQRQGLRFVVVPDARRYPPQSWLRQPRDWLRRIDFDTDRYLLEVQS
jgi:hypothetical protein